MCIIILNKSGEIRKEYLENSAENNPDGGGISWIENKQLYMFKSLNNERIIQKYYKLREFNKSPILVHFRISTGGTTNISNCHPFWVNPNLVMCHNGTLYKMRKMSKMSDTRHFNENILTNLSREFSVFNVNFMKIESLYSLIKLYVRETNSKMVFFNRFGNFKIINEFKGNWVANTWYSNYSYMRDTFAREFYGESYIYDKKEETIYDKFIEEEENVNNVFDECMNHETIKNNN